MALIGAIHSEAQSDYDYSVKIGDTIRFEGRVHASVGFNYKLDFDTDAFDSEEEFRYSYPKKMAERLCGGDDAVRRFYLVPKKKGVFVIKEQIYFRGHLDENIVKVKVY